MFQSLLHQGISLLPLSGMRQSRTHTHSFQSLLHQGISLLRYMGRQQRQRMGAFQSLLHQGISLLDSTPAAFAISFWRFQSLLHQGISLLRHAGRSWRMPALRFNPFFIRASVYWRPPAPTTSRRASAVSIPSSSGHQFTAFPSIFLWQDKQTDSFNPFFIRASVYCLSSTWTYNEILNAIPFQSLLHQGISLLDSSKAVIRAWPGTFQSLLHQGISLLNMTKVESQTESDNVSIPSSSGHQFTVICGTVYGW